MREAPAGPATIGPPICVTLRSLAGDALELHVANDSDVSALKAQASLGLRVPPLCQKLIAGGVVLEDAEALASHCQGGHSLSLTLLVSLDAACRELDSGVPCRQAAALASLAELGPRGGAQAVAAVAAQLAQRDVGVRRAAVGAIAEVSVRGDGHAVDAVSAFLEAPSAFTRASGEHSERVTAKWAPGSPPPRKGPLPFKWFMKSPTSLPILLYLCGANDVLDSQMACWW